MGTVIPQLWAGCSDSARVPEAAGVGPETTPRNGKALGESRLQSMLRAVLCKPSGIYSRGAVLTVANLLKVEEFLYGSEGRGF